jgi:hypothetical protein
MLRIKKNPSSARLPRSLRRTAKSARAGMEGRFSVHRFGRWTQRQQHWLISPWASLLPPAVAFAGVWALHQSVSFEQLRHAASAKTFLATIWQVEAVALALSGAVVIFGYQALSASKHAHYPGAVKAYAQDNGLFLFLGLSVSGLVLPASVLLGYGGGAAGWPATWASIVCFLGLLAIPAVFVIALKGTDERILDHRRNRRIRKTIDVRVRRDVLERLALSIAMDKCPDFGITVLPLSVSSHSPGYRSVTSKRNGVVRDIRLRRFQRLIDATSGTPSDPPKAYLMAHIGGHLNVGGPFALVAATNHQNERSEQKIVRLTT